VNAPGVRERAEHRLDILARQLDRVGIADLRRIVTVDETREHRRRRESAGRAIRAAGLGDLLDDARPRFETWAERVFSFGGYDPTWIALNWGRSLGPVGDRVATFLTIDDAVLATVAYELIPDIDRQALIEPFDRMMALRPDRRAGQVEP
jgi:hypothetical protein